MHLKSDESELWGMDENEIRHDRDFNPIKMTLSLAAAVMTLNPESRLGKRCLGGVWDDLGIPKAQEADELFNMSPEDVARALIAEKQHMIARAEVDQSSAQESERG